jgi:AcrR family transcriptional regulator
MILPVDADGSETPDSAGGAPPASDWTEGLRERKKRLTRSLISNTATELFMERGFDDVKVAEVAEACGVSEKTVYNYFPTKESLLLDREPELAAEIWRTLGPGAAAASPVDGALEALATGRREMLANWENESREYHRRFFELIETTPSLRTAMRDMLDRLEQTAAEALAQRTGVSPDQPEPRIAASALIALWRIQSDGLLRSAIEGRSAAQTEETVLEEVKRAARVVESGLWWFGPAVDGRPTRQQLKTAADAAATAGRQILAAVRQARTAWEQMQREGKTRPGGEVGIPALADFLAETERWKHDMVGQKDEWKRAYREEQVRLRQAQRDFAREFKQQFHKELHQQMRQAGRGRRRGPGSAPEREG